MNKLIILGNPIIISGKGVIKMKRNNKRNNKEAILSIVVTSALIITLAVAVMSAVKRPESNGQSENNVVDLNEENNLNVAIKTEDVTEKSVNDIKTADAEDTKKVGEKTEETAGEEPDADEVPSQGSDEIEVISPDNVTSNFSFSESDLLVWPVSGEIVLPFSMESTIWFPTLSVYKCNPAIYIGSAVGNNVTAAASGVVEEITANEELGTMVVLSIGSGYKLTYGQLDGVTLAVGDVVLSGEVIGTVANPTIYYSEEGSGLYFELEKDGEAIDPVMFLGE